ncbi:MAG: triose-phosphate isomerase [Bacillota bacterium]
MNKLIISPFFLLGIKGYLYGNKLLQLARASDLISIKYEVDIILTPQPVDIRLLVDNTEHLFIFAQHMDAVKPGIGNGLILPEAVKAAGADGVILNHPEKQMNFSELSKAINRARDLKLTTIVSVSSIQEAEAVSKFEPDIILAERPELIATGNTAETEFTLKIIDAVVKNDPNILIVQGGGISRGEDVYKAICSGVDGVGAASAIMEAEESIEKLEDMVRAVRNAWNN